MVVPRLQEKGHKPETPLFETFRRDPVTTYKQDPTLKSIFEDRTKNIKTLKDARRALYDIRDTLLETKLPFVFAFVVGPVTTKGNKEDVDYLNRNYERLHRATHAAVSHLKSINPSKPIVFPFSTTTLIGIGTSQKSAEAQVLAEFGRHGLTSEEIQVEFKLHCRKMIENNSPHLKVLPSFKYWKSAGTMDELDTAFNLGLQIDWGFREQPEIEHIARTIRGIKGQQNNNGN